MDAVREDMVEVTEEDAEDRNKWRWKINCGDPWWEKPKEEGVHGPETNVAYACLSHQAISLPDTQLTARNRIYANVDWNNIYTQKT